VIVGFTGTRTGLTASQERRLAQLLDRPGIEEAHHGDCVGADAEFHALAADRRIRTVAHPPKDAKHRAYCRADVILPPRPYHNRNHDIIRACGFLIACPQEDREPAVARGQGTWSTVRHARRVARRHLIVWPDGSVF
jgi:hypothetical protein